MKKLSVVIPSFNESVYIIRCLENVILEKVDGYIKEIIVVDDGSTDDTDTLLQKFNIKQTKITIISSTKNEGKGAALRKGIAKASGDIVIIQDADLEYDPIDYNTILSEFNDKKINVVYGSRILGSKIYHNYSANIFFLMGGITLTKLVNAIFHTKLTDQPTCYKAWRNFLSKDLLRYCKSDGFAFEVEMTAFFSKKGFIKEVPIHYYPRTVSHGKKIKLSDFITSVITLLYCRFRSS